MGSEMCIRDREIEESKDALARKEAELEEREKLVDLSVSKEKAKEIKDLEKRLKAEQLVWDKKIADLNSEIEEKQRQLKDLSLQIELAEDDLNRISEREQELDRLDKSLKDREKSLVAKEKDLAYQKALFRAKVREAQMEKVIYGDSKSES